MTDTELLRKQINKRGLKLVFVAETLGITYQGFLKKLNNETEFKASEIQKLSELLRLSERQRDKIFFANNVERNSTSATA